MSYKKLSIKMYIYIYIYIYNIILAFQHNSDVSLEKHFRSFKKEVFNKS